jgi:hypothetical protein
MFSGYADWNLFSSIGGDRRFGREDRVIRVVIGQETWSAHGAFEPETAFSALSCCTTGLGFCAALFRT